MAEVVVFPLDRERCDADRRKSIVPATAVEEDPVKSSSTVKPDHKPATNRHRVLRPCCRAGAFGDPL